MCCTNVLEVGTALKIKNTEFTFHFRSTLIWSAGSAEYSFHVARAREAWPICCFPARFLNQPYLSLPFPTKTGCHSPDSVKCYKSLLRAAVRGSLDESVQIKITDAYLPRDCSNLRCCFFLKNKKEML